MNELECNDKNFSYETCQDCGAFDECKQIYEEKGKEWFQ